MPRTWPTPSTGWDTTALVWHPAATALPRLTLATDIDWEYPGGNGQDYRQNPNSGKTDEITGYALFLKEVKAAIGSKELSIAVPGLERDMIAFTADQAPLINAAVDVVNVRRPWSYLRQLADELPS